MWPGPGEPSGLCNWHILGTAWNEEFWGHRRKILAGICWGQGQPLFSDTCVQMWLPECWEKVQGLGTP